MKRKTLSAILLSLMAALLMSSCGGGNSGSTNKSSTSRDYYNAKDSRNTDKHYDNGEYKEALKNARKTWDAKK